MAEKGDSIAIVPQDVDNPKATYHWSSRSPLPTQRVAFSSTSLADRICSTTESHDISQTISSIPGQLKALEYDRATGALKSYRTTPNATKLPTAPTFALKAAKLPLKPSPPMISFSFRSASSALSSATTPSSHATRTRRLSHTPIPPSRDAETTRVSLRKNHYSREYRPSYSTEFGRYRDSSPRRSPSPPGHRHKRHKESDADFSYNRRRRDSNSTLEEGSINTYIRRSGTAPSRHSRERSSSPRQELKYCTSSPRKASYVQGDSLASNRPSVSSHRQHGSKDVSFAFSHASHSGMPISAAILFPSSVYNESLKQSKLDTRETEDGEVLESFNRRPRTAAEDRDEKWMAGTLQHSWASGPNVIAPTPSPATVYPSPAPSLLLLSSESPTESYKKSTKFDSSLESPAQTTPPLLALSDQSFSNPFVNIEMPSKINLSSLPEESAEVVKTLTESTCALRTFIIVAAEYKRKGLYIAAEEVAKAGLRLWEASSETMLITPILLFLATLYNQLAKSPCDDAQKEEYLSLSAGHLRRVQELRDAPAGPWLQMRNVSGTTVKALTAPQTIEEGSPATPATPSMSLQDLPTPPSSNDIAERLEDMISSVRADLISERTAKRSAEDEVHRERVARRSFEDQSRAQEDEIQRLRNIVEAQRGQLLMAGITPSS